VRGSVGDGGNGAVARPAQRPPANARIRSDARSSETKAPRMSLPDPEAEVPGSVGDHVPADIAAHIDEERRRVSLLGEVREIVFGAQDGLVSTLAVVAVVAAATDDRLAVLIAGLASAVAGVFSMAAGEYLGSKSQAEIFEQQIERERVEVAERPEEAEAEVAYLFAEEGLPEDEAGQVARILARHPDSVLATMVAKELGVIPVDQTGTEGGPLRGALIMGGVFAAGGLVPILPFLFASGMVALWWSAGLTGGALFAIGAAKSRWTGRSWIASGLEVFSLAAVAGVAGYLFGSVLPSMLGFAVP
jgi:vacuolar iron transporter family protein